jgi:WD40 repeat protein
VTALAFYQDGINIAAGTPSGSIYIYNLKDSNVKIILKGHEGSPITCLEFKRPDHYKSRPKSKKKPEEQKIKSYEDIRTETRN